MKKRFVICLNSPTKLQQNVITQFLKDSGVGYWHWFPGVWLVTDAYLGWTSVTFRDKLNTLVPGVANFIIQIEGNHAWHGFGQSTMFQWFHDNWDQE